MKLESILLCFTRDVRDVGFPIEFAGIACVVQLVLRGLREHCL